MATVVIIGGGLGGLFCGALLAKEGLTVSLVEKNSTVGGGLQTFRRFGETFDTGMHVIGGMQPGGNIRRICEYLDVADDMHLCDVDDTCIDSLYFAEDHTWYNIAKGREGFITSLAAYFPKEREALTEYVAAVFALVDSMDLFFLRPSSAALTVHSSDFLISADAFIAKYIHDVRLRSVLAYMNPLYGGRGGQTPAYIHAVITVLYIHGATRFVGGSDRFAATLAGYITAHGGTIRTNEGAAEVAVRDQRVEYVRTCRGTVLTADYYISAIHPCALLPLLTPHAFPRAYCTRLESIPNSYSAFSLYIQLKENSFPYINHSEYYMTRYDEIWHFGRDDKPWPLGFLFMTPPEEGQDAYARKVLVTAPMPFSFVLPWEDTTVGHRGDSYRAWKAEMAERLLTLIEEMHPHFREAIANINTSSPLTIRDFFGAKEGGISGYSKDCNNIILSQLPVVTKVRNLLLTGQNNSLHGFCGVPLTAITTCEAIVGKNHILNSIAACS